MQIGGGWSVGVLGLVEEASRRWKETVLMASGFGPDGPHSSARGEWLEPSSEIWAIFKQNHTRRSALLLNISMAVIWS